MLLKRTRCDGPEREEHQAKTKAGLGRPPNLPCPMFLSAPYTSLSSASITRSGVSVYMQA